MKDFLLIANTNACTYKEFFPLLKERKVSMGVEMPKEYVMPDGTTKKFGNICWYTTLHTPDKKKLVLSKKYHHELYPHYDNYRAIEVSRIKDIPYDYECVMGVPITIFGYDLDNVEILDCKEPALTMNDIAALGITEYPSRQINHNGKKCQKTYHRIMIKKKIVIRGIWAGHREESEFIVKGTPTYVDEKNKSYQGPVVNGKAKYARVVISLTRRKRS